MKYKLLQEIDFLFVSVQLVLNSLLGAGNKKMCKLWSLPSIGSNVGHEKNTRNYNSDKSWGKRQTLIRAGENIPRKQRKERL